MNFCHFRNIPFGIFIGLISVTAFASTDCHEPIRAEKELVITDLSVVNDPRAHAPNGPWTFGYLMRQLTPKGMHPSDFVLRWLNEWMLTKKIASDMVEPRKAIEKIVSDWPKKEDGRLDLDRAPLRLLAIVNRIDNRGPFTRGGAGEGRFVFSFLAPNGTPLSFTVIFEYLLPRLPKKGLTVRSWARRWHALGNHSFGEQYNRALQEITDLFTRRGSFPGRRNHSALNQLRTNEISLASPWQMREFKLSRNGMLKMTTTKQTPAEHFNVGSIEDEHSKLIRWMIDHKDEILAEKHIVPRQLLGAKSHAPFVWAPKANELGQEMKKVRKVFALNTCNGCHSSETNTSFLHIAPRSAETSARLSQFMVSDVGRRVDAMRAILCDRAHEVPVLVRPH
ncbi:MAG: hypothetical protein AB1540_12590 [Bdellovibrionota bacterium]